MDQSKLCKPQGRFDTDGKIEKLEGLEKANFRPKWADEKKRIYIDGVDEINFKFYRPGGARPMPYMAFFITLNLLL